MEEPGTGGGRFVDRWTHVNRDDTTMFLELGMQVAFGHSLGKMPDPNCPAAHLCFERQRGRKGKEGERRGNVTSIAILITSYREQRAPES